MKLLYLANDFALSDNNTLSTSSKIVTRPNPRYDQEKPRYTPVVALLVLFVFAGFSLTIPLHPTRSAVPNGCSTSVALPPGESTSNCILQATNSNRSTERPVEPTGTNATYLMNGQVVSGMFAKAKFSRTLRSKLVADANAVASQS